MDKAYDGSFRIGHQTGTPQTGDAAATGSALVSPWLQYKFDTPQSDVVAVNLWPRGDSSYNQLTNVTVYVSNSSTIGSGAVCRSGVTATAQDERIYMDCPNAPPNAQWVTVRRFSTTSATLAVGEIEVLRRGEYHSWTARCIHSAP